MYPNPNAAVAANTWPIRFRRIRLISMIINTVPRFLLAFHAVVASVACAATEIRGQDDDWDALRQQMIETQIRARDVDSPVVLKAMARVPRHLFVPEHVRRNAYEDRPLPIGMGQTISQPYIVGY